MVFTQYCPERILSQSLCPHLKIRISFNNNNNTHEKTQQTKWEPFGYAVELLQVSPELCCPSWSCDCGGTLHLCSLLEVLPAKLEDLSFL